MFLWDWLLLFFPSHHFAREKPPRLPLQSMRAGGQTGGLYRRGRVRELVGQLASLKSLTDLLTSPNRVWGGRGCRCLGGGAATMKINCEVGKLTLASASHCEHRG